MIAGPPRLSVVVPAHNSGPGLTDTVEKLTAALADWPDAEVIVIENGSTDGTWERAQELGAREWPIPVTVCRSETGLGRAYGEGIRRAKGDVLLLTADDLPFDMTDVDAWKAAGYPKGLVVGSKAHPGSTVPRALVRRVMTFVFTGLRRGVLQLNVGDTQGTVFVPAEWGRSILPSLKEPGYLFSTELLYAGHLQGLAISEVPIRLRPREEDGGTRIKVSDILQMASGLVRLRRRSGEFTQR